jgi:hypothetical protein
MRATEQICQEMSRLQNLNRWRVPWWMSLESKLWWRSYRGAYNAVSLFIDLGVCIRVEECWRTGHNRLLILEIR